MRYSDTGSALHEMLRAHRATEAWLAAQRRGPTPSPPPTPSPSAGAAGAGAEGPQGRAPAPAPPVNGGSDCVTPRRGRRRRDPGGVWALRESVWNATQRDARRQAILAQLREVIPEGERGLAGWPAICDFLNRLGLRNREGGLVTPRVARGWRRRLGMPALRGRPGQNGLYGASLPWTTTYALTAWALSLYRSGGPEMPRIVGKSIDSTSGS